MSTFLLQRHLITILHSSFQLWSIDKGNSNPASKMSEDLPPFVRTDSSTIDPHLTTSDASNIDQQLAEMNYVTITNDSPTSDNSSSDSDNNIESTPAERQQHVDQLIERIRRRQSESPRQHLLRQLGNMSTEEHSAVSDSLRPRLPTTEIFRLQTLLHAAEARESARSHSRISSDARDITPERVRPPSGPEDAPVVLRARLATPERPLSMPELEEELPPQLFTVEPQPQRDEPIGPRPSLISDTQRSEINNIMQHLENLGIETPRLPSLHQRLVNAENQFRGIPPPHVSAADREFLTEAMQRMNELGINLPLRSSLRQQLEDVEDHLRGIPEPDDQQRGRTLFFNDRFGNPMIVRDNRPGGYRIMPSESPPSLNAETISSLPGFVSMDVRGNIHRTPPQASVTTPSTSPSVLEAFARIPVPANDSGPIFAPGPRPSLGVHEAFARIQAPDTASRPIFGPGPTSSSSSSSCSSLSDQSDDEDEPLHSYYHRIDGAEFRLITPKDFVWTASYERRMQDILKTFEKRHPDRSFAWKCNRIVKVLQGYVNIKEGTLDEFSDYCTKHKYDDRPTVKMTEKSSSS